MKFDVFKVVPLRVSLMYLLRGCVALTVCVGFGIIGTHPISPFQQDNKSLWNKYFSLIAYTFDRF